MAFGYERWVGRRYVRSKSRQRSVSLISSISMAGIAIAVAVLIVVLSVVNGFDRELRERLLTMTAHGSIEGLNSRMDFWEEADALANAHPDVIGTAPYIGGQSLMIFGEQLSGAELRGIDAEREHAVSGVGDVMVAGELTEVTPGAFNVVLGEELANKLEIGVGDKVTVTLPQGIVTPAGVSPRTKRFTVSGIFRVGMYEYDHRLAYIHLSDAQRLYRLGNAVSGIRLEVNDVFDANRITLDVAKTMPEAVYYASWDQRHVNFFRSIQITKQILFVILLLVIAVAAFNIVSTLVMVVREKQSDIAILKTMGARPGSIYKIFVTQGSIIGVTGTVIGVVAGMLLALNLETIVGFLESAFGIKFLAADVYFISDLPSSPEFGDVAIIAIISLLLTLVSTVYPSVLASNTRPAEALRYD